MFPVLLMTENASNEVGINANPRNPLPSLRQTDNSRSESFADTSIDYGNFKYTTIINRSLSVETSSVDTLNVENENENFTHKKTKIVKKNSTESDQKLPECDKSKEKGSSYFYVNKNGFTVRSSVSPSKNSPLKEDQINQTANPVLCNNFLTEMSKKNKQKSSAKDSKRMKLDNESEQSVTRSVPSRDQSLDLNQSNNSSTNSLVRRNETGDLVINTNLTIQEPHNDITDEHVKYINLFSILCCWCFPITGLLSIFYSRLTTKYYDMRDIVNAKKYLKKAEWMLIITFIFGFTLIAIGFAFFESYMFKDTPRSIQRTLLHTGLPK